MTRNTCTACGGEGISGEYVPELCGEGEDRPCEACGGSGEASPAFVSVAVYLVDRAYGGPEEGGWWYHCGEIVNHRLDGIDAADMVRIFDGANEEAARQWRDQLQAKLDAGPNVGRRSIGSVLSEGNYAAIIEDGMPLHRFPAVRPHYE